MPLTPEDVVRKTFGQARFRGYVTSEVDAFLEEVTAELQRLATMVDELRAAQIAGRSVQSEEDRRAGIELAQLEQVRKERADLVQEISVLQERFDWLKSSVEQLGDQGATSP